MSERRRGTIPPEAVFGSLSELHPSCIFKTLLPNLLFVALKLYNVHVLDPLGQLFQMAMDKEAETLCTWVRVQTYYVPVSCAYDASAHTRLCGLPVLFSDNEV